MRFSLCGRASSPGGCGDSESRAGCGGGLFVCVASPVSLAEILFLLTLVLSFLSVRWWMEVVRGGGASGSTGGLGLGLVEGKDS